MRLSPVAYRPIQSYQFQVIFTPLHNGLTFFANAKAVTLPSIENNPMSIDYGNVYTYIKGKTRWSEVVMTLYLLGQPNTSNNLWEYLQTHQKIENGVDYFKKDYMKDVQIQLLTPDNNVKGTWKLINAFISSINLGNLDWSSDEIVQPEISFIYDYAIYTT